MTLPSYPIRFAPTYQHYLWGGDQIREKYRRGQLEQRIAESWEVSDRPEGMSVALSGPCQGLSLQELVRRFPEQLLGLNKTSFPLLIKILDAREPLSVQVHPNERTASLTQGESKNEMWYVLEASQDAMVYAGFKPGMNRNKFLQAMQEQSIPDTLQKIPVSAGDAIYVPGGCVHAIGAGCLMLEVQQNSNTTYRVYDWDRKDAHGQSRELHLEQAFIAMDWSYQNTKKALEELSRRKAYTLWSVLSTPDFHVQRIDIDTAWTIPNCPNTFQIFFCISGASTLAVDGLAEFLEPGTTYLVPAQFRHGNILGSCQLLRIFS